MAYLEILWAGLKVTFIGLGITFVVLAFLILCINLFRPGIIRKIFDKTAKKEESVDIKQDVKVENITYEVNDDKLIAAITAAITCYYQTNNVNPKLGFRVRSIREIK